VQDIVAEAIQSVIDLVRPYTAEDAPLTMRPLDSRMTGVQVVFDGQEHTLGCLLEAMLHELYLTTEAPDAPITYAAYKVPHPLHRTMTINLGTKEGANVRKIINAAAEKAQSIFEELGRAWAAFIAAPP
jgi:DNA-directed RNA polymerase subunit L